jgi:hypothetical protein
MAEAGEQATGTRDESYDLISVLYHTLQAASEVEQYIRDAEEAGRQDLAEFFRDYQEAQRDLAERAKNLLGSRLVGGQGMAKASEPGKPHGDKLVIEVQRNAGAHTAGAPVNAQMKSGGRTGDDIVDEQSKESFPASDSPAKY